LIEEKELGAQSIEQENAVDGETVLPDQDFRDPTEVRNIDPHVGLKENFDLFEESILRTSCSRCG